MTVVEAAAELGVHPETIRRAIRARRLRATKDRLHKGRPFQIEMRDLRAYVAVFKDQGDW